MSPRKSQKPLSETHPDLALEAYEWDPNTITYGSQKMLLWKCLKGHIWEQSPNNRTAQEFGCPICSNKRVLAGYNDLKTTDPDLASQAHNWDPTTVTRGRQDQKEWKCNLGHVWTAKILNRALNNSGCPYCDGKKVLNGFNDLATTHPELAKEADGWDPTKINFGSNKKFNWKCKEGHKWSAQLLSRSYGRGCPYCTGRKILVGFNDLNTTHPELAKQALEWNPQNFSAGSNKKVKWKCEKGHVWQAMIVNRTGAESGCPKCAITGFDQTKEGFLYLLVHDDWQMYQIGITNYPDQRIHRHSLKGWRVLELRGPMDGLLTMNWETAILKMLKSVGADLRNAKIVGKFDGYSESWSKNTFIPKSIKYLMDKTEEMGF